VRYDCCIPFFFSKEGVTSNLYATQKVATTSAPRSQIQHLIDFLCFVH
jgi:hypothetical protein